MAGPLPLPPPPPRAAPLLLSGDVDGDDVRVAVVEAAAEVGEAAAGVGDTPAECCAAVVPVEVADDVGVAVAEGVGETVGTATQAGSGAHVSAAVLLTQVAFTVTPTHPAPHPIVAMYGASTPPTLWVATASTTTPGGRVAAVGTLHSVQVSGNGSHVIDDAFVWQVDVRYGAW